VEIFPRRHAEGHGDDAKEERVDDLRVARRSPLRLWLLPGLTPVKPAAACGCCVCGGGESGVELWR
jgi:hypothetical protein